MSSKDYILPVRLDSEQRSLIEQAAASSYLDVSTFVRQAALLAAQEVQKQRAAQEALVRHVEKRRLAPGVAKPRSRK